MLVDEERELVGAVRRTAVLDDAQPPRGDLVEDQVAQDHDEVGDVLLEAVACDRLLAALAGDDRGDTPVGEPLEEALDLAAYDDFVAEGREEDLDGVEHDALGFDRVDLGAEAHEQALEVVLAGLLYLVALDADVVEGEQALSLRGP